jgi:hypothetical protein
MVVRAIGMAGRHRQRHALVRGMEVRWRDIPAVRAAYDMTAGERKDGV